MRKVFLYLFTAIIYITPTYLLANDSLLKISYPKDNTLQRETTLNTIINISSKSIDEIKVISAFGESKINVIDSKVIYCKNVRLRLGENSIIVRAYKNKVKVDEQTTRVYVKSEIYYEYKFPPKKYKQNFFHNDANEVKCVKCHDMSVNETEGVPFMDVNESNCYECHSNITNEKYAHAPAVNWLCTSCHNGKPGSDNIQSKGLSKHIAPEPVNQECFRCHQKNLKLWNSYKYRHAPLDSGRCNKCHNPHSSPYKMFVRKPVDQICLGCHKDKHIKAQVVKNSECAGTSIGKKCIECHSPHASDRPFFLKSKKTK